MILRRVPAYDQHHVGVLDVDPAIRHGPASKCWPQTGDRWTVSNPGLILEECYSQTTHGLDDQVVELVSVGAAAVPGDAFQTIYRAALRIGGDKRFVASLLDMPPDFVERLIPTNVFPMIRPRASRPPLSTLFPYTTLFRTSSAPCSSQVTEDS